MKKFITFLLSFLSPLAAAPTGWAIYAGVTEQPAFPMWQPAAIIGAMAVISTTAAAGLLIVDILKHNSEARDAEEKKMNLPSWYGWAILAGCTTAEVILSLLIVVYSDALKWGVLAFPLVTMAGVFALAVRMTLEERISDRVRMRNQQVQEQAIQKAKEEQEKEKNKQERKARMQVRQEEKKLAATLQQEPVKEPDPLPKVARKSVKDADLLAYLARNPGASQQQVADHFHVTRQAMGPRIKKLYEVKQ